MTDYRNVIELVANEARDIEGVIEPGVTGPTLGLKRPVFTFRIGPSTFDAFFNSPAGYRGQYLAHPDIGQACNNLFIRKLSDGLLAGCRWLRSSEQMDESAIRSALLGNSAKVWIDEDRHFDFRSPTVDLAVESWEALASMGGQKAKWGLCAPEGDTLKVFGAWINDWGAEVVTPDKIGRRYELHNCGFS